MDGRGAVFALQANRDPRLLFSQMKIRAYLLLMVVAIILPIAIFAAVALQILLRSERESALSSLDETVSATTLLVDRELSSAEAALRVLARSPDLAAGDMAHFYEHARTADRGDGGRTILFAADGQQIVNTVVPLGTPLPPPPDYVRKRTRQVIETQRAVVSDVITGAVQRIPVTTINVPVPLDRGQRYVLGAVFAPDYFLRLIAKRVIPRSWTLSVIDSGGRFIARSGDASALGQMANPALLSAVQTQERGQLRSTTRDGIDSYYAFNRSPMSGWTIAVSAPATEIEAAARQAVTLAALGMLVALLFAAGAAILFGRRLVDAIGGAARAAAALGGGRTGTLYRAGIAEVDELYRSIDDSGRKLAQSEVAREQFLLREQEARRVAEQQNRIKDEFLAMLSHELRNPLSGIVGAVALLTMKNASAETTGRATEILVRQSKHLTRIVDDLLDLARLSRGKIKLALRPVELSALVQAALDALRVAGRIAHTVHYQGEPVWVEADRTRLEQIVTNLLTNALKYTPAGGRIDIALSAEASEAVLVVRDSGVGIAPELMPRLFDIFVQGNVSLDRSQGGLGIGLALVHQLVTLHRGSIGAASDGPGKGSTFTVRLPRLAREADVAEEGAGRTAAPPGQRPSSVLLIEDNDDVRGMLAANLSAAGYRVLEASNGASGIPLAKAFLPPASIIDIGLPGMDGYEIAARLRKDPATSHIRLIALTGYGQEADRRRALDAGFDRHLVKPPQLDELIDCLAGR
jgi:signal transduction histidine kinase/CheY-like chemotaxis protein